MRTKFNRVKGGIAAPKGFLAAGIHCGLKPDKHYDLALLVSQDPGPIAGVFTSNTLPAAPVILDRQFLKHRQGQAIIINSGNANAFTGAEGIRHSKEMSRQVANALGLNHKMVFVGSTGVIGVPLPIETICRGIPRIISKLRKSGGRGAAKAIMTTDTRPKEIALQRRIAGKLITIGGMAKGSGMIHPNMATMLAYLTSDVRISQPLLQKTLRAITEQTFNCISVDGETSTNDTVLCLTNGFGENSTLEPHSRAFNQFREMLHEVCHFLALEICRDGEGASKVVKIQVTGTSNHQQAKSIAETLATSPLIKTAIFGADPNWGRVIMALGRSGVSMTPSKLTIAFDGIPIVRNGRFLGSSIERHIRTIMQKRHYSLNISVGRGIGRATLWTTDLTYEYVRINASYRS